MAFALSKDKYHTEELIWQRWLCALPSEPYLAR